MSPFLYMTVGPSCAWRGNAVENARAEALADAARGIQALLSPDTGIQFGEEVEQVLEKPPALREALACRLEVQTLLPERPRQTGDWRLDDTAYDFRREGPTLSKAWQARSKLLVPIWDYDRVS